MVDSLIAKGLPSTTYPLNQDLPLEKEKDPSHALAQSHDQTNGGDQKQVKSSCLQWCWVQVMVVEKRRLEGAVVIEDEMIKVKVEYKMVAMVLSPVEGEEQGQGL